MSPFALAGVLGSLCVPGHRAIFHGVHALRPGCAVRLDVITGRVDELPWHSVRAAAIEARRTPFTGTRTEAVRTLSGLVDDAVQRRLASDVPVGVLLSGGVDSSLVLAGLHRAGASHVKAFTVGFKDPRYDERSHAREVARHFNTECIEAEVDEANLPTLVEAALDCFDEPFADSSAIPTMLVARLARREVGVVLAGDGGDDLFAGYDRHVRGFGVSRTVGRMPGFVRRAVARGLTAVPSNRWDDVLTPLERMLPGALRRKQRGRLLHKAATLLRAEDAEEIWRGFYGVWPDPAALIAQLPSDAWHSAVAREAHAREHPLPNDEAGYLDELLLRDQTMYLPDDLLVKLDRATMECSLEAREPLLDQRLFEFAWRVPPAWRTKGGVGKSLLRDVLAMRVPAHIASRPKAGFGVPLRDWLAGPLRDWAESLLGADCLGAQGILDSAMVRQAWQRCLGGDDSAASQVWSACVVARWCQRNGVDASRVARP
ncbi:MAG: hypothetical protein JNK53_03435 [Phycisphaerae bacterium]|nr:hypothetical protein [Phycisphaerae bacterium]